MKKPRFVSMDGLRAAFSVNVLEIRVQGFDRRDWFE
jgi:hypothetical protein